MSFEVVIITKMLKKSHIAQEEESPVTAGLKLLLIFGYEKVLSTPTGGWISISYQRQPIQDSTDILLPSVCTCRLVF